MSDGRMIWGVTMQGVSRDQALEQMERVLSSPTFQGAVRSRALLKFLVEESAGERADRLKDTRSGPRRWARARRSTRARTRSSAPKRRGCGAGWSATTPTRASATPVVIVLAKGSYVPQIQARAEPAESQLGPILGPTSTRSPTRDRVMWLLAGVALGGAVMVLWAWQRPSGDPGSRSPMQFEVELQTNGALASDVGTDVVISPDGTRLVFVVRGQDGVVRLATRRMDQADVTELPDTTGARMPFFSPDGAWVGFWAAGSLKKIAIDGGSPVVLCQAVDLLGASWGEDGTIVAALSFGTLSRVPSSGGQPTVVADLTGASIDPRWPQVLRGGRHVLYTAVGPQGPNNASLEVLSLVDGKRTPVVRGGTFGRCRRRSLPGVRQPGNAVRTAVRPRPVDGCVSHADSDPQRRLVLINFRICPVRRLEHGHACLSSKSSPRPAPSHLDRNGRTDAAVADERRRYTFPRLSSDGRRLALASTESGVTSIWVHDVGTDRTKRLNAAAGEYSPTWSPDGRVLVVGSRGGLHWLAVDGSAEAAPLTKSNTIQVPWSFSPDGTRLAYHELNSTAGFDLWTLPVQHTERGLVAGPPELFLRTPAYETYPAFSPDGRWIAYGSGAYGRWDVYVRPFPDNGSNEVRVSDSGGRIPFWTSNGRELLYRTDDQRVMVVPYSVEGTRFVAGKPRPWTTIQLGDTGVISNLDLDPTTGRVLALMPADGDRNRQSPNHVTIRLNAVEELGRLTSQTRH